MSDKEKRPSGEESIGKLIAAAGAGPTASPEARQRIYAATHRRWRETTAKHHQAPQQPASAQTRPQKRGESVVAFRREGADHGAASASRRRAWPYRTFAVAATVALAAVALTWLVAERPASDGDADIASFVRVEGSLELFAGSGDTLARGQAVQAVAVRPGHTLVTGPDGRAALQLGPDLMLRANVDSRLAFRSGSEIELLAGTVYVDSGGSDRPLRIATPFGPVEHRGTQYELSLDDRSLRLRVREGSVVYGSASDEIIGQAGEQLVIDAAGVASRDLIAADDDGWQWAAELATLAPADGYPGDELLAWIARERGLTLEFADPQTQTRVGDDTLRGLDGFDPYAALDLAARTAGFGYEVSNGRLLIGPQP